MEKRVSNFKDDHHYGGDYDEGGAGLGEGHGHGGRRDGHKRGDDKFDVLDLVEWRGKRADHEIYEKPGRWGSLPKKMAGSLSNMIATSYYPSTSGRLARTRIFV